LDVLVRMVARGNAPRRRTPLSLSLVIDRSGSMRGSRLQAAKAATQALIERLHDDDEVGVVVYDDDVGALLPLQSAASARQQAAEALDSVQSGGSTDLHGGWLAGAQQVAPRTGAERLCRVILLSDGKVNRGETNEARIVEQVRMLAQSGVTTTTVGLGEGFNESLMTAMAVAGQGNALYGDLAEDLAEPFESEIELLSHLAWRDVQLSTGSATTRWTLLNDYTRSADGSWAMPCVAVGAEAWACFTVPMDSAIRAQQRSRQGKAFHVTVQARDADGRVHTFKASLPALPVVDRSRWATLAEDELVKRRMTELRAADLQRRARQAVNEGDWATAENLLIRVQELAVDQPWLRQTVAAMRDLLHRRDRERISKELAYASHAMSRRITEADEQADFYAGMEATKAAYLRRKGMQGRRSGA
jgi:Ca-activated chloride channel family protein